MAVKIRLSKVGRTHQVSYRIVAQDVRTKRDGKFLEILGFVNSHDKNNSLKINKDRIKFFVSKGATFTPSAKFVFEKGTLPPRPKKQREQKEAKPAPVATQPTQEPAENNAPTENIEVSEPQAQTQAQAQTETKEVKADSQEQTESPQPVQGESENQEKAPEEQAS